MLRKIMVILMTAAVIGSASWAPAFAEEKKPAQVDLAPNAKSAILIDADTGTVIYEKNPHEKLPPASITKVMSMLLIMEALDEGRIKLTDMVRTSEYAASMGGSQIFLEPGEEMSVNDMLKGIAMASGNDATVAMAEKIAGSEEMFVQMMNDKAKELGLKDTHFVNTNGLPAEEHYSSAYDIAMMSRELLKHEEIIQYTSKYQDYLRQDSDNPFWLVNTNKLVRFYPGADGLKTGFTSEAKFCLAATAKRNNFRIISVVMGEPNTKTRNAEVSQLFDYAFAHYDNVPIYKKGDVIGKLKIRKAELEEMELKADQHYSILTKKGQSPDQFTHEIVLDPKLKAPIQKDQQIGELVVKNGDEIIKKFPIKSDQAIDKATWWQLFKRTMKKMVFFD
ncbi:D-alanyl-D-alanine carboxypeptidase family protein [Marinicrinis lubricantis]|uniref:serine-type D-Ala-D-Ala carboxypeptidase n=1 Tax=Marinicrinis lubricantis TaxID=2086470 RepID=A0ABW1ISK0_9BACL